VRKVNRKIGTRSSGLIAGILPELRTARIIERPSQIESGLYEKRCCPCRFVLKAKGRSKANEQPLLLQRTPLSSLRFGVVDSPHQLGYRPLHRPRIADFY
jgi:hypothetical protein